MKGIIMKKLILFIMLSLCFSFHISEAAGIRWESYSNQVFEDAKKNHKWILMVSTSNFCEWCKKMDSTTFSDPTVIALINEHFIPVILNVDDNSDIADRYKINDLPTTIIFDSNGNQKQFIGGYTTTDKYLLILKNIASSEK